MLTGCASTEEIADEPEPTYIAETTDEVLAAPTSVPLSGGTEAARASDETVRIDRPKNGLAEVVVETKADDRHEVIRDLVVEARGAIAEQRTPGFAVQPVDDLVLTDPTALAGRMGGGFAVMLSLLALTVATLSTNIAANVVSPANAIINLAPKKITFQQISKQGIQNIGKTIITMAEAEGLDAHANAVKIRLNQL